MRAYKKEHAPWKDSCIDLTKPTVRKEIERYLDAAEKRAERHERGIWTPRDEKKGLSWFLS
jgi:hypothetical protein